MAKKNAPSKASTSKRKAASHPLRETTPKAKRTVTGSEGVGAAPAAVATQAPSPAAKTSDPTRPPTARATLPAEAALSFLRDTKGVVSWSLRDLSHTLNIAREEAERVVALLQIQGYVQPESHKAGEWMTTPSGETVSGAKLPRFDRETVEGALTSLKQRIEEKNKDRAAIFQITRAVAFGDFLAKDRSRVQPADVGIELARRDRLQTPDEIETPHSAADAREEQTFLRQLRGRSALINLKIYSEWMGSRTHQKLF
jgi:hypothetical protein